uniref:site-specific integrase n=1 Tax=Acetatifactor sp. TaxID=1872090 RepID=UPI004056A320
MYPHSLRHTFATAYVIHGGDPESLRLHIGHSSLDITQKYLYLANQFDFNTNIYKLDERFFKRK